jgi:hypothetical protein
MSLIHTLMVLFWYQFFKATSQFLSTRLEKSYEVRKPSPLLVMPVSSTARSSIVEFPDGIMVTDVEDTHEHAKLVFDTVMSSPVCHF